MKGMMAGRGCCEAPLKKSNHHNAVIFAFIIARKAELIAGAAFPGRAMPNLQGF